MSFYGYTQQAKDYGFIDRAGQQVAQGVTQVISAYEKNNQAKLDLKTVEDARVKRIKEAAQEYLEATGGAGPDAKRKAYAYASQMYYKPMGAEMENPQLAIERMDKTDGTHYKKLADQKKKRYFNEVAPQKVGVEYDRTLGQVGVGATPEQPVQRPVTPTTPEQAQGNRAADTARLSVTPQSIGEMQSQALYSPRTVEEVEVPPPSPGERQTLANKYGIASDTDVTADISRASSEELGNKQYAPGTTRDQVAQDAAGLPEYTPVSKDIVGSFPTRDQVATQNRLTQAAKDKLLMQGENLKAKKWQISLRDRKLTSDESLEITKALALAQTRKLDLQLKAKAIEARLTTANKQGFDKELDQESIRQQLSDLNEINESLLNNTETEAIYRQLLEGEKKKKGDTTPPVKNNDPLGIR